MMNGALRVGIVALALTGAGCMGHGLQVVSGGHGAGPGGYGPPRAGSPGHGASGYGQGGLVRCESRDNRRNYCAADTRDGMRLVRQLSSERCVQGSTWGYDARGVWVVAGCRGEFASAAAGQYAGRPGGAGYGQRPGHGGGQLVRCESRDNRRRRCNAEVRQDVEMVRQLSRTRCVQRQNWGWDRRGVWVGGGCGAEFRIR